MEASLDALLEKLGVAETPGEEPGRSGASLEQSVGEMMATPGEAVGRPSSGRVQRGSPDDAPVFNTGQVLREAVVELDQKRAFEAAATAEEEAARAASSIPELDEQLADLASGVLDAEAPRVDGAGRPIGMPEGLGSAKYRDPSTPAGMVRMSEPVDRFEEGKRSATVDKAGEGAPADAAKTSEGVGAGSTIVRAGGGEDSGELGGVKIAPEMRSEEADGGLKGAKIEQRESRDVSDAGLAGAKIEPRERREKNKPGGVEGGSIIAADAGSAPAAPDGARIAPEAAREETEGMKGATIAPRPPESVPMAADHGPPLIPMPDLTAKYEPPKKPVAEKVRATLAPAASKAVSSAAHAATAAAGAAAPAALHALAAASRPLANKPRSVRQSVGWIAANTAFVAVVLWFYLLFLRHPGSAAAAGDGFDLKTSKLPAPPQAKVDAPKKEQRSEEGHKEGGAKKESGHGESH